MAFLLIGCDEEKSNKSPFEGLLGKADSETKPTEAVSVENPNLKYVIEGDAVTITSCAEDASGELVIPTKIEGKSVTKIGNKDFVGPFFMRDKLTSITIPNSVTSIDPNAFYKCNSLKSITIPDNVTSIGDDAFLGCSSLTGITIPNGVTSIGITAFYNCSNLKSITIGNGVTSIGNRAFYWCSSLTSITIGNGVTSIGKEVFVNCDSLTSITIPDGVTSIGEKAFYYCTNLSAVTFLGDAPKNSNDAFNESSPTIYRKADAKGWGDTFAGRPVKLITEKP